MKQPIIAGIVAIALTGCGTQMKIVTVDVPVPIVPQCPEVPQCQYKSGELTDQDVKNDPGKVAQYINYDLTCAKGEAKALRMCYDELKRTSILVKPVVDDITKLKANIEAAQQPQLDK